MSGTLDTKDIIVFLIYFIVVSGYGYWIYQRKKSATADTKDFFLAEGTLTWWAIGASLIASNISAEQFIGMSGSGFAMGLAIASYEWMAAATLLVVAVFLLPIYLRNKIYTMPQFLAQRYSPLVATTLAVFWLVVYVFVNLTSILHLGALAVSTISGISYEACIFGLTIFAVFITLGGMKVIGYTDVIQVLVLILGGLATTYLALDLVAHHYGGSGALNGLSLLREHASSHFHMILQPGQMMMPDGSGGEKDAFQDLPGIAVLVGAMWIANLSYWGMNQYITQRALGADLNTARAGLLFAAFLKLLMPIIVVLPGIAAYLLFQQGEFQEQITEGGFVKPDKAYPVLINLLPTGLKGLSFAALTAAIVASLAGKANSISTIFTLDLYKKYFNRDASEANQVMVGRVVIIIALIIGAIVAPVLRNFAQAFQFIQNFTGLISPGITAIFLLGFFWKKTTASAAMAGAIATIPAGIALENLLPNLPFMHRMGWVFLIVVGLMILISLLDTKGRKNVRSIDVEVSDFKTAPAFTVGMVVIVIILAVLYSMFW
ncbi:MAG TPA: sodium/solute symporter [Haliscomenobacter sp.]|uniref:sodium:solute symporter family transporter n=1 Tax=Haliscomenobacter sp. TaxID=2717303 RepID=UPI002B9A9BBA|nr:sodium/solute symporter [Haliscomenobacter sp.]HOY16459.1 sodium/solute symporter [Haliscomenobacter sp.]HPH20803.1 sodium/solute symporter [Haliscomenobacter sp.]